MSSEINVFVADFEVEKGLSAGAGEFLLDDFECANERQQPLANLPTASQGGTVWGGKKLPLIPTLCSEYFSLFRKILSFCIQKPV